MTTSSHLLNQMAPSLHQDSVDKADILNKQFQMAFSSKSENNPAKQAIPNGVFIEVRNNHRNFQE